MNPDCSRGQLLDELHQLHRQLDEHRAMLARALRLSAMSEMAAELIHELNQPLVAIHNYAQAIQHAASKGAAANVDFILQCAESIDAVAADARSMLERLRKYTVRRELHRAPVRINDLILKSLELIRFEIESHQIRLDLQLSPDLPEVDVDAVQIGQVLVNLVRNALEAVAGQDSEARRITIGSRQRKDCLEVFVEDHGPGVSGALAGHLFRPFHTTKEEGLGLGLAICESIVAGHDGRIWHEGLIPHGARFCFTVPQHPPEPPNSA